VGWGTKENGSCDGKVVKMMVVVKMRTALLC